jgi:hypothetical protein
VSDSRELGGGEFWDVEPTSFCRLLSLLEDLRRVARELNNGLEDDELVAMIEEFDLEGKGGVGVEEFERICMG